MNAQEMAVAVLKDSDGKLVPTFHNALCSEFYRRTGENLNKVLFQMGVNDSSTLIDSPAASRLGFHRALLANEESGLLEKFRPYAVPDAALLEHVAKALRGRA